MFRLDGRVAVITGGLSGIGAGVADLFAEAGADLVLPRYAAHGQDAGGVERVVRGWGRRAVVLDGDVRDSESVDQIVAAALETFGRLDIVVANAAISPAIPSLNVSDDVWQQTLEVNLLGVFRCFRAALPTMIESGWGRLLATSSTAGAVLGWLDHAHYTAAKSGVIGLVRTLALEVAPHGITVNAVAPGLVPTPMSLDPVNSLGPERVSAFERFVPVGRNGHPKDIAAAFLFLASEEASFITGQTLVVDGGMGIRPPD